MTWSSRLLPFPDNLSPGQCRYSEAVQAYGTCVAAAEALGISAATLENGLKKARWRAGVNKTDDLLVRYARMKRGAL